MVTYSPTAVTSLVLSLYYGFAGGVPFITLMSVASFYLYEDFPMKELLWNTLIVLIASEFRYYWLRRIRSAELEKEYLQEHITRLRKELFLIKLSHDQLEFNYIVKPYSLRQMVRELRDKLMREGDIGTVVRYFLNVLSQNFQIYRAAVYRYSEGEFNYIAGLGGAERNPDRNDPLLRAAVESEETHYLPPKALRRLTTNGAGFKYLAVVFTSAEEERFILTIEDIIFVNLNEETLTHIYILLQYMLEDIVFSQKISPLYREKPQRCAFEFIREFYKMYELYKKVGVHSSVVVFKADKLSPEVKYELEHAGRSLDMVCIDESRSLVIYLLPFTALINAKSFANRLVNRYKFLELVSYHELNKPILEEVLSEEMV
ncbi:hypothetical protein [Hydrogenivirga sp.]